MIEKMDYNQRLKEYEKEKQHLLNSKLSCKEYEVAIRKLADKWKI